MKSADSASKAAKRPRSEAQPSEGGPLQGRER